MMMIDDIDDVDDDDDDDDGGGGGGQGIVQEEIAGQPCEEPWRGAELVRIIIRHIGIIIRYIGIIIGNYWNHHWKSLESSLDTLELSPSASSQLGHSRPSTTLA